MPTSPTRNTWLADQPLQRKILLAIGALLALFVATNLTNLASISGNDESRSWSSHTYVVLLTLADVSDAARARQAAVRGYLLSRDEGEYADFEAADAALSSHLATLRQLTADNPLQQSRLDRLQDLLGRWRADALAHALRPMRAARGDATPEAASAREAIRARYFAERSVTADDMRTLIDTMSSTERALLDARNA
ncbi:MAG: CHASE3 domain-containing protein, partial [Luteibacter jiangsuensis]